MTNEQFIQTFERHLGVGGLKRKEIIGEVTSHLQEQSVDAFGDPIVLARKMNRVHLGIFSSFWSLVMTAAGVTALFDIIIPYVGFVYHGSPVWKDVSWISSVLWQCIPFISPLLFIYGAHTISRMRNRWVYVALLTAIFTAGYTIQQELMQAMGYLLIQSVDGSESFWAVHVQPMVSFLITYGIIGYGMMVVSSGRQFIISRHQSIDIGLAFVLESAAAYYILPMAWNAMTSFHYTEVMYEWSVPVFENLVLVSVAIGLLGALAEWIRIRATKTLVAKV